MTQPTPPSQRLSAEHSGQPWHRLTLAQLVRYRTRYWSLLRTQRLSERERALYTRWSAELAGELGLRLVLRLR